MAPGLIINGIDLPQRARLEYQQTFWLVEGGSSSRRMANGRLFTMSHWQRWATTISGGGWVPPPLLGLPIGEPFEVHAVAPVSLLPGQALPPGWTARADCPEVTTTDARGVTVRLVYPVLTVVTLTGARLVVGGGAPKWELICEEG
jgi:hypothetical protein